MNLLKSKSFKRKKIHSRKFVAIQNDFMMWLALSFIGGGTKCSSNRATYTSHTYFVVVSVVLLLRSLLSSFHFFFVVFRLK